MQCLDHIKESIFIYALKHASMMNGLRISDTKIKNILTNYGSIDNFLRNPESSCFCDVIEKSLEIDAGSLVKLIDIDSAYANLKEYQSLGISFTNFTAPDYPQQLKELENPPSIIYYYGDINKFNHQKSLSIVGTRRASLYGKRATRSLVYSLKDFKPCIVSGLAKGIDSEAHIAALEYKIPTIAVLGSGLLKVHNKYKNILFDEMVKDPETLILSEFEPRQDAHEWTFPMRNRIISALGKITIVIEAGTKSGALITAGASESLGRKIFAVPGELDRETFVGSNQLLKDGKASPLYSAKQIVEEMGLLSAGLNPDSSARDFSSKASIKEKIFKDLPANSWTILNSFNKEIHTYDEIQTMTEFEHSSLISNLTLLEIKGLIKKLPGSRYQKF